MKKYTDIYNQLWKIETDSLNEVDSDLLMTKRISTERIGHDKLMTKMKMAIKRMTGKKYEVWNLLLIGKTQADIATILNISRSSVRIHYKRGINYIRKIVLE